MSATVNAARKRRSIDTGTKPHLVRVQVDALLRLPAEQSGIPTLPESAGPAGPTLGPERATIPTRCPVWASRSATTLTAGTCTSRGAAFTRRP